MARNWRNKRASFFRRMALSPPAFAFGQHVQFAGLSKQLHLHRLAHLLPRQIQPLLLILADLAAWGSHQVEDLTRRSAHLFQHRFGRNPAIHDPYASRPAVAEFNLVQKAAQGGAIRGVAIHHFIGQRESFRRNHQRDHHLLRIKPLISAVTVLGFSNLFTLPLDIRAGQ